MTAQHLLAVAALVFGTALPAPAQDRTLEGIVRDRNGAPVPGVVVTVSHPRELQVRVAITDLEGRYEIRPVEHIDRSVEYRVEASHPDYRKEELRLQPRTAGIQAITLEPRRRGLFRSR